MLLFAITLAVVAGSLLLYEHLRHRRAIELVVAAQQARTTVACKGVVQTRAYTPEGLVQSRAEVHRGEGRVVIRYLDGPAEGMEVIQADGQVWTRGGRGRGGRMMHTGHGAGEVDPDLLGEHYFAHIIGQATVAGRPATRLALRRHDGGGLDLWLDRESSLPLRTVVILPGGKAVSDTQYESIQYGVQPPSAQTPPRGQHGAGMAIEPTDAAGMEKALGFTPLQPSYVPAGFRPQGSYLHRMHGGQRVAGEMRYTDGLEALSIIQAKAGEAGMRGGGHGPPGRGGGMGRGRGSREGHGKGSGVPRRFERGLGPSGDVVVTREGDIDIMVMGDLPRDELERVAAGMQ